jgi:hypothetical protein
VPKFYRDADTQYLSLRYVKLALQAANVGTRADAVTQPDRTVRDANGQWVHGVLRMRFSKGTPWTPRSLSSEIATVA